MSPSSHKRVFSAPRYIRKTVPSGERAASWIILVLLIAIGTGVAVKGRYFDPRRYRMDEKALAATRASTPAPAALPAQPAAASEASPEEGGDAAAQGTVRREDGEGGGPAPAEALGGPELELKAESLQAAGPTENYTAETMYQKIDGRADAYLAFNVKGMRFRSFSVGGDASKFVDVYEYNMGTPMRSFGIFAATRDAAAPPTDFVADGYRSGSSIFMRRGPILAEIIASDETPEMAKAAERLARAMVAQIPEDDTGLGGLKALPVAKQIAGSFEFLERDAFSLSFLKDVFVAKYDFEGAQFKFFMAPQADDAAAADIFAKYKEMSQKYGKIQAERETAGARVFEVESYGAWDLIFQRGKMVGGVNSAPSPDAPRKFLDQYLNGSIK